jgi:hypothetical protein
MVEPHEVLDLLGRGELLQRADRHGVDIPGHPGKGQIAERLRRDGLGQPALLDDLSRDRLEQLYGDDPPETANVTAAKG